MKSDHLKQNAAQVVMHIFLLQPKSAKNICEYTTCQTLKQQQQKTTPSAKNNNVRLQLTSAHQIGK